MNKLLFAICAFGFLLLYTPLPAQENQDTTNKVSLFVDGVCGMCKERIEKAVAKTPGIIDADWKVDTRNLSVTFDPGKFDEEKLHRNIANAGHDTEKLTAPDKAYNKLHDCCKYRNASVRSAHQPKEDNDNSLEIFVDGVCGMCKERIENAVAKTPGIIDADWKVDTRNLSVTFDPGKFDEEKLHRNIADAGHDTEKLTAPDKAYEKLHDCCKYRNAGVRSAHQPGKTSEPEAVQGVIFQEDEDGEREPLTGANIVWLGTNQGTTTDAEGRFQLQRPEGASTLVASYVGFPSDTINMEGDNAVEIVFSNALTLEEVEVRHRKRTTEYSFLDATKVQNIGKDELLKAACCNLSESFETNPAVDVSFTDAVTGTRQIEMLGLAGPYVQVTRENIPDVRGLSAIYGLTYIPGPWVDGIQLIKGTGSVVNGYESMSGQINVELIKPEKEERLYLNLFGNEGGRFEANADYAHSLSDKWHTGLLLHGRYQNAKHDRNDDGFLDNPLGEELIAVNRWKYTGDNGTAGQFGIKATYIDNQSGQVAFAPGETNSNNAWGAGINTKRIDGWMKIGRVLGGDPNASLGFQLSGSYHDQTAFFGNRDYLADQSSVYSNLIYQNIIGDTRHTFKTGLSFQWDQFNELLDTAAFERNEIVPGAFFEYNYLPTEKWTLVAGLRVDHHNLFGLFATPRLHVRYAPSEFTVLRASAGRGQRTASIIAENIGGLASSRQWIVHSENPDTPYGLDAEASWNFGLNLTQELPLGSRNLLLSFDAYHTRFINQIVVDYDRNPQELHFYNLDGVSYSNSFQVQGDYELLPRWDLRLAYRFNDVQTTFSSVERQKPLVARHRAFLNTGYETNNAWKFDLTLNWQGNKRIPFTASNPAEYRLADRSPDFMVVNAQISKGWKDKFEIYAGAENLLNFRQPNPILASNAPFGPYFDSSLIWGPVFGRMVYGGIRYRIW